MDKGNHATWHSRNPQKQENTSEESSNSNGVILPDENPMMEEPCKFTAEALSNFLVLQNIFRYLNGEDLEPCKVVNQRWNFALGQIYTRHYEVIIKPASKRPHPKSDKKITEQNHVTIQKLYWSSKRSDKKKFSFPNAVALLLNECSKERKFAIDLGNEIPTDPADEAIHDFLSKIGHLVNEFTAYSRNEFVDSLCRLSNRYFTNLSYLNLFHATFRFIGWEHYNDFLRDYEFSTLRKICFGMSLEHFEIPDSVKVAEWLIKMAPNLKEIHEFPVQLVNALISTGKTNLVKSICYPNSALMGEQFGDDSDSDSDDEDEKEIINGGPLEIALKKFAQLDPKLISFNFSMSYRSQRSVECEQPYPSNYFYDESLEPIIYQILQSSHQSLETLAVHLSASFDFEGISPITSLKKIRFINSEEFDDFESFTTNVNLERVFPNVTTVEIMMYCIDDEENYSPLRLFSPWGSKIKELILNGIFWLDSDTVRPLAESFPFLKSLKFLGSRPISPDTLKDTFPLIADLWPRLEVIIIGMKDEGTQTREYHRYSFDSMFTGISKKSLAQLTTPAGRMKIPRKKIEDFYLHSTIRKLSNLKILELDFHYRSGEEREAFLDKLCRITSLSREFGFDFLPPTFKILVRERGSPSIFKVQRDLKKIQEDLANVVALEFETIKEEHDQIIYYF